MKRTFVHDAWNPEGSASGAGSHPSGEGRRVVLRCHPELSFSTANRQRVERELGGPARCSNACARLKVVDYRRRLDGLRDFAEMAVMGEVDHLTRGGHSRE